MEPSNVHDFSGFLPDIHLSDSFSLPTYFVVVSFALCVSLLWLVRRVEKRTLNRVQALDIALIVMIAGFVGSRLFHIFFEEPHYYAENPWRVFEVWRGGFVWYGGVVLGAGSGLLYLRWKSLNFGIWLDVFAPVCAFGYALGRVACWLTGCCYGDVCVMPASLHWLTGPDDFRFRHPTQVYAVVFELVVLAVLLRLERRSAWVNALPGRLFTIWMVLHGVGRILMESFRADPRGPEPFGLSIATWISFVLIGAGIWFLLRSKPRGH